MLVIWRPSLPAPFHLQEMSAATERQTFCLAGKLVLLETNNVTDLESGWTMQAIQTGPNHLFEGLQGVVGVEIQSTFFGNALAVSPDLNGDYTNDVVVGLQGQTNPTGGDSFDGAVFILHLRPAAGVSMKLQ